MVRSTSAGEVIANENDLRDYCAVCCRRRHRYQYLNGQSCDANIHDQVVVMVEWWVDVQAKLALALQRVYNMASYSFRVHGNSPPL